MEGEVETAGNQPGVEGGGEDFVDAPDKPGHDG